MANEDLKLRAEKIAKAAAAVVADYRRKQASQAVWVIVGTDGVLHFTQDQIAQAPVFESRQDAESELDNLYSLEGGEEEHAHLAIREATLTIKPEATAAPIAASSKQADMDDVVLPSKQRWPEFMPLVDKLKTQVVRTIQAEADKIQSDMPYKQQAVLEILIHELQELV